MLLFSVQISNLYKILTLSWYDLNRPALKNTETSIARNDSSQPQLIVSRTQIPSLATMLYFNTSLIVKSSLFFLIQELETEFNTIWFFWY